MTINLKKICVFFSKEARIKKNTHALLAYINIFMYIQIITDEQLLL